MSDLRLPKAPGFRWEIKRLVPTHYQQEFYAVCLQKRRWFKWETVLTDTTIVAETATDEDFKYVATRMYNAFNYQDPYEGVYK